MVTFFKKTTTLKYIFISCGPKPLVELSTYNFYLNKKNRKKKAKETRNLFTI